MNLRTRTICLHLFLFSMIFSVAISAAEPDYVKGETLKDRNSYWALGPTGIIADVWGLKGNRQTRETRTFRVREVLEGSPATGKLAAGDVILGVISPPIPGAVSDDSRFISDAAVALAKAIAAAEGPEQGGKLVLNVWRDGEVLPVTLGLKVLGSYKLSSPWDCEKTDSVVTATAAFLIQRGFTRVNRRGTELPLNGIDHILEVLGLLATGEEQYLPTVRAFARQLGPPDLAFDERGNTQHGPNTWGIAYRTLFLAEYYLATKDEYVLPGLRTCATTIARGRSGVGTWGHSLIPQASAYRYGPATGYGAMNQCSITCSIALALVQKCGIDEAEINEAVDRAAEFLRWYVDKGCIPYGDHAPSRYIDNNGRNSQAAVLFDLLGDAVSANYFTRMALASYNQREDGHSGHFFCWLWGALGTARGGDVAAQSFIRHTRWFTEVERRHDGSAVYQFQLAGKDHGKHRDWSTAGCRLLQHCLPRKTLYITGKGGSSIAPVVGDELKQVVAAGVYDPASLSSEALLADLGSWCVPVRAQAAAELGKRDDDVVAELIAMLDSPNRYARYGACIGLRQAGRASTAAVDALIEKLQSSDDLTLRFFAVNALAIPRDAKKQPNGLGDAVRRTVPALLTLAATHDPQQDPMRKLHMNIAHILFYGGRVKPERGYFPSGKGSESIDRALLIPAIKSWLENPNGAARTQAAVVFEHLSEQDLALLWGDIYRAAETPAPSGVMFGGGVRTGGIKVMAQHNVKEGLALGLQHVLDQEGWGDMNRKSNGIPALMPYGTALGDSLPRLETLAKSWSTHDSADRRRKGKTFLQLIEKARQTTPAPAMSIKQHLSK